MIIIFITIYGTDEFFIDLKTNEFKLAILLIANEFCNFDKRLLI